MSPRSGLTNMYVDGVPSNGNFHMDGVYSDASYGGLRFPKALFTAMTVTIDDDASLMVNCSWYVEEKVHMGPPT